MSSTNVNAAPRDYQKEEANRKLIVDVFNSGNVQALLDLMVDNYKQHNPTVPDGKAGAVAFFTDMAKRFPNMKARLARVAADGDLVWLHAHLFQGPDDPGTAMVDIFRIENGKIVEHWDVLQPCPEKPANNNTMF